MNILLWVENYSSALGLAITILLFVIGTLIVQRKEFYDNKPYISVVPVFEKRILSANEKGEPTLQEGFIRYISVGNFGKSVAIDVVIDFLYDDVWENPHKIEEISICGKYRIKYLPPSISKDYWRSSYISYIRDGWYPEKVRISYKFRNKQIVDTYYLTAKDIDERFEELSEYNQKDFTNQSFREASRHELK